jgi:hypothetical protein
MVGDFEVISESLLHPRASICVARRIGMRATLTICQRTDRDDVTDTTNNTVFFSDSDSLERRPGLAAKLNTGFGPGRAAAFYCDVNPIHDFIEPGAVTTGSGDAPPRSSSAAASTCSSSSSSRPMSPPPSMSTTTNVCRPATAAPPWSMPAPASGSRSSYGGRCRAEALSGTVSAPSGVGHGIREWVVGSNPAMTEDKSARR